MNKEQVQYVNKLIDMNKKIKKITEGYGKNLSIYNYNYDEKQPENLVYIEGKGVEIIMEGLKKLQSFNEEQLKELEVSE